MNDENLYLQATEEVETEARNSALWAKAMALSDGDSEKAKYSYIKLRVEQLEAKEQQPVHTIEPQPEPSQTASPRLGETQTTNLVESKPVAEIKRQSKESSINWLEVLGFWAILIVVVLFYAYQAHPHTTGIDFIFAALGALFGAWLIAAIFFGLTAAFYWGVSGNKLKGFTVAVPVIAAALVIITIFVVY